MPRRFPPRLDMHKTKMCPFVSPGKLCNKRHCSYAHFESEIKSPPNLSMTKLCRATLHEKECNNPNCGYAHCWRELKGDVGDHRFYHTRPCFFWSKNLCKNGERCRFAHGEPQLRSREPASSKNRGKVRSRDFSVEQISMPSQVTVSVSEICPNKESVIHSVLEEPEEGEFEMPTLQLAVLNDEAQIDDPAIGYEVGLEMVILSDRNVDVNRRQMENFVKSFKAQPIKSHFSVLSTASSNSKSYSSDNMHLLDPEASEHNSDFVPTTVERPPNVNSSFYSQENLLIHSVLSDIEPADPSPQINRGILKYYHCNLAHQALDQNVHQDDFASSMRSNESNFYTAFSPKTFLSNESFYCNVHTLVESSGYYEE